MSEDIFITGDSGLLGSMLVKALRDDPAYIVWNDRLREAMGEADLKWFLSPWHYFGTSLVRPAELDVTNEANIEWLRHLLPRRTTLIHIAAYNRTDKCEAYPMEAVNSNVFATQLMAELTKTLDGRLVYFSSTVVHDPHYYQDHVIDEADPIGPQTLYGLTKYIGERIVTDTLSSGQWMIVRPVFVYGDAPTDNASMIRAILQAYAFGTRVDVLLDLAKIKDYFRVEYFTQMFMALLRVPWEQRAGDIFILGRGAGKPFAHYLRLMADVCGCLPESLETAVNIQPAGDYLGNHVAVGSRFARLLPDYRHPPEAFDDRAGILKTWQSICRFIDSLDAASGSLHDLGDRDAYRR